jgi:two-component system response regulator DesR
MRSGLARLAGRALGAQALALDDLVQAAAARRFGHAAPRLLLLGLRRGDDPAPAVAAARRIAPIVICVPEQGDAAGIRAALGAGADGYVLPESLTPEALRAAVETIEAGGPALPDEPPEGAGAEVALAITARCHEVLRSLADGLHDREIAERLGISTSSVRKHVANAQLRLNARTRTQAVALAARDGLV